MSREEDRIITYNGSSRASSRGTSYASGRSYNRAVGESAATPKGLSYTQDLNPFDRDPRDSRAGKRAFSKISRSGSITPITDDDLTSARVTTRPAASSVSRSGARSNARTRSGFNASAFDVFNDLDKELASIGSIGQGGSRYRQASAYEEPASTPRAAVEMYDPAAEDDADVASSKSRKKESRSKAKAKAKAEKLFSRQFGKQDAAAESGSRAAVYKGEMGRNHKRAFADLGGFDRSSEQGGGATLSMPFAGVLSGLRGALSEKKVTIVAIVAAVVCVCMFVACMLFPAVQQYYVEMREQARLQVEYDAVSAYNASLQSNIDSLSTDEGMQDAARQQLGWVQEGETAGTVLGLGENEGVESADNVASQVEDGSVLAPDTWYSALLDLVFGYEKGTTTAAAAAEASAAAEDAASEADAASASESASE